MANILIFGDSIGQGYYDTEGGWVDRLKRYFIEQEMLQKWEQSINVFNLSISGDTTEEILNRLVNEIPPRHWLLQKVVTIIAVGLNDSAILSGEKPVTSSKQFEKNLYQILRSQKDIPKKLFFLD